MLKQERTQQFFKNDLRIGTSHMDIWGCAGEVSWQPGSLASSILRLSAC